MCFRERAVGPHAACDGLARPPRPLATSTPHRGQTSARRCGDRLALGTDLTGESTSQIRGTGDGKALTLEVGSSATLPTQPVNTYARPRKQCHGFGGMIPTSIQMDFVVFIQHDEVWHAASHTTWYAANRT
jgi:hypothetical protein